MKRFLLTCVVLLLAAGQALAISGAGAINMTFNTSVRASGMGEAGVALTEGMDTNHWANPALLAYRPGIHYLKFESHLAEGLSDNIWLTNEEATFHYEGVTLLWARGPLEGNYLDMGTQVSTDEEGNLLGEFNPYLESQSWGLGVDAVLVAERLLDREPGTWSRYVSLAGGVTWHDYEDKLAHDDALGGDGGGSAEGSARSQGFVLKVTPLDATRGRGVLDNGVFGLRLTGSYGKSVLNKTDDFIQHSDSDQDDPYPRLHVDGWAATFEVTLADDLRRDLNDWGLGILGDMINPLVSLTRAEQTIEPGFMWTGGDYVYEHDTSGDIEEVGRGWEVCFMNTIYWRGGHTTAAYGDVDGKTEGGGFRIQAGRLGGFRKDWADVPQATGLPDVRRESWSVWVDPFAIHEALNR